jgi:hypothetical protein
MVRWIYAVKMRPFPLSAKHDWLYIAARLTDVHTDHRALFSLHAGRADLVAAVGCEFFSTKIHK